LTATALHLEFAVLIGPKDESHFKRVDGLSCKVLQGLR